jgi:outer membrane protein assembly factor BamB
MVVIKIYEQPVLQYKGRKMKQYAKLFPSFPPLFFIFLLAFLVSFLEKIEKINAQAVEQIDALWRRAVGGVVLGTPSAQAGSVAAVIDGGSVKAYSWQGVFLWEYFAQGKLCPFITRSWDGVVYICRTNGVLTALNRTGRELWKTNIKAPLSAPIVAGWDGRVFVSTEGKIFCVNNEGKILWTREFAGEILIEPALDKEGGVLLVLDSNELVKISAFGKMESIPLEKTPVALVSFLYKNKNTALILYEDGIAEARVFGGFEENPPSFPAFSASPLDAKEYRGQIAVALSDGKLIMLTQNGETLWEAETSVSDGVRLMHDEAGVYALGLSGAAGFHRSGVEKWSLRIERAASPPVFGKEGVLYSSGTDWILYAYQLEYGGYAWGDSLYGAAPTGDYGLGKLPLQKSDYYQFSDFDLAYQFGRIRKKMSQGQIGEDEPVFITYLKEVAGSMRNSLSIPETNAPASVSRRVEAARLLAAFGSHELIPFFADLLLGDREPPVKAAAAEAIGRIGVDPYGIAMEAFAQLVSLPSRDGQVLTATAAAVGALCRFSGPPMIELGVRILAAIAANGAPVPARKRALLELKRLR